MYFEIKSIVYNLNRFTDVAVQCGVSRGIPIIKMYGSVSREYTRYRELLPYTFAQIGRRLPQRKIHVNYASPDKNIGCRELDLPTAVAIYGATVGMNGQDIYTAGELSMDGLITASGSMGALLYILHHRSQHRKAVVIGADQIDDINFLYPDIEYFQTPDLRSVIRYLEGDLGEVSSIPIGELDNSIVKPSLYPNDLTVDNYHVKPRQYNTLHDQLSASHGLNCILIRDPSTDRDRIISSARSDIGLPIDIEMRRLSLALNGLLRANSGNHGVIVGIDGLERLTALLEASGLVRTGSTISVSLTRDQLSDIRIQQKLVKMLTRRLGVIFEIPTCFCGYSDHCTCSTIERSNFRRLIHELAIATGYLEIEGSSLIPEMELTKEDPRLEGQKNQKEWVDEMVHSSSDRAQMKAIKGDLKATLIKVSQHTEENLSLL